MGNTLKSRLQCSLLCCVRMSMLWGRLMVLAVVRLYQIIVSQWTPASCRFYPTCSQYTFKAIQSYGVFRGTVLGAKRVLRCHPFSKGGYDPVPQSFEAIGRKQAR